MPFISISAPSIVSGMSGESEKQLRETFEEAAVRVLLSCVSRAKADNSRIQKNAPCILFIDEIDAITPKRENAQREMERRIVAQLLTCMDGKSQLHIVLSTMRLTIHLTQIYHGTRLTISLLWSSPQQIDLIPSILLFDELVVSMPKSRWVYPMKLVESGELVTQCRKVPVELISTLSFHRILRVLMAKLRLSGDFDYAFLAKSTPGYVGADLSALTGAAGVIAVKRIFEQLGEDAPIDLTTTEGAIGLLGEVATEEAMIMDEESTTPSTSIPTTPAAEDVPPPSLESPVPVPAAVPPFATLPPSLAALPIASFLRTHPSSLTSDQLSTLALTNADFTRALSIVQPSSQREGFTTVPDVTWEDLGALQAVREEMRMSIVRPIRRPDVFKMLGLNAPCGVLLWGPPGCGKTLLAKAVANESRANFISVKGPELLNKVSSIAVFPV